MDLKELYSLRRNFTIIGLTGRTGSGCTKVANLLSGDFKKLEGELRKPEELGDTVFSRKYQACYDFIKHDKNWQPFTMISYKDVLLFFIMSRYGNDRNKLSDLFTKHFRLDESEDNSAYVERITNQFVSIHRDHKVIIDKIGKYKSDFSSIRSDNDLEDLHDAFFSLMFSDFRNKVFDLLQSVDYQRRTAFLHHIACNIRDSADPFLNGSNIENIYTIANLINRLIKAKKYLNGKEDKPTKIVIDSLRNSLEIMFFKERYSAFYMIACKDEANGSEKNIKSHLEELEIDKNKLDENIKFVLKLDEIEYRCKDFREGRFSSPDVENCIQKSDIHILNRSLKNLKNDRKKLKKKERGHDLERIQLQFYSTEEQILKIVSLIHQPGIISPGASERCMQIAHTSKLNSGCISRQVGAVVTDKTYSVKSVGWNDVPRGSTPCKLRSYEEYYNDTVKAPHFSDFELSDKEMVKQVKTSYKYKGKEPGDFKKAMEFYFKESYEQNKNFLNGKKCSFCFKTVHNFYEGESNQVHTKSLHAEENAMLQISKNGGQPLREGYLFTTASPCELCAKKAYQLGITKIFYIDPYPGISQSQIIHNGDRNNIPEMLSFNGVIGKAYEKLYEPFMSYKDEVSMMLDLKPKKREGILTESIIDHFNDGLEQGKMKKLLNNKKIKDEDILELIRERYLKDSTE